ncbi:hypothetical protein BDR04DRAFT_1121922 [Suillus decipiens]|nr:hypothetical protein BDR04DRAFT_1121922 [Suillus decipiens]
MCSCPRQFNTPIESVAPTLLISPETEEPLQLSVLTAQEHLNTHKCRYTPDSDSDSDIYHTYTQNNMLGTKTTHVEQPAPTKPPFLSTGDITPKILCNWEMGCRQYFKHKDIPEEEQVEYMTEFRVYWLPSDWADVMRQKLLTSNQGNKPFNKWAVEKPTCTLISEPSTALKESPPSKNSVHGLKRSDSWMKNVCGEKRLNTSLQYNSKTGWSTPGKMGTFVRVPPLTDKEHTLLHDNDRCFKCREPFAGHRTNTCSKGFPDGTSYKTLMAASIAAKKNRSNGRMVALVEVDNTVAVVMPSAALRNGTDSDECVAPLTTPLLLWDCHVDGPAVSSPVHVSVLIDNGSAAVLIDQ